MSPVFDVARLARVTPEDPLRILFSACLVGERVGWEGDAYASDLALRLLGLPCVKAVRFCPENVGLGTPRPFTTIHDGNGRDVLAGTARVLETTGRDVTAELTAGARAMVELAREARVELAIMNEISDSCGSHALYFGDPAVRRYQKGTGVAAALVLDAGIPIVGHRDYATLGRIVAALDPTFQPDPAALDFVDQEWFGDYFAEGSPGLPLAEWEQQKLKRARS